MQQYVWKVSGKDMQSPVRQYISKILEQLIVQIFVLIFRQNPYIFQCPPYVLDERCTDRCNKKL